MEHQSKNLAECRKKKSSALKDKRVQWALKARTYYENHKKNLAERIQKHRIARNNGNYFVDAEPKVIFAIRLKGINKLNPKYRMVLKLLRLRQINNGVFVKVNKSSLALLQKVLPFITYGYPSRRTISDLIYKRGYGKINRSRIPLTDNALIETNLGKHKIDCVEDLIEEIHQCGPHFKEANNFLWPFKLHNPKGGWKNKNHPFQKDGDWGNRDKKVNELIEKMI